MPNLHPYSVATRRRARDLAAFLAPAARAAAPAFLVPSGDTYLSSRSPHHNFGHAKRLRVDATPRQHALLRFDATRVNRSAVGRALLYLSPLSSSRRGLAVRRGSSHYWHEKRVTYSDRIAPGVPIARTGRLRARHWKAVDVTALLDGSPVIQLSLTTRSGNNRIATVVVAPSTPAGLQVPTRFDHYSLLRTTEEMLGLPALGQAGAATSMRRDFHL